MLHGLDIVWYWPESSSVAKHGLCLPRSTICSMANRDNLVGLAFESHSMAALIVTP
jgi:hypothetical protein